MASVCNPVHTLRPRLKVATPSKVQGSSTRPCLHQQHCRVTRQSCPNHCRRQMYQVAVTAPLEDSCTQWSLFTTHTAVCSRLLDLLMAILEHKHQALRLQFGVAKVQECPLLLGQVKAEESSPSGKKKQLQGGQKRQVVEALLGSAICFLSGHSLLIEPGQRTSHTTEERVQITSSEARLRHLPCLCAQLLGPGWGIVVK